MTIDEAIALVKIERECVKGQMRVIENVKSVIYCKIVQS